jgi:integrase
MARGFDPKKTKHPGVYYIMGTAHDGKPEKIFYISYYREGKRHYEKAGREKQDDMTASRASRIRGAKIEGTALPNKERREEEAATKAAEAGRWTFDRLWNQWKAGNTPKDDGSPHAKANPHAKDDNRYKTHLQGPFGSKEPKDVVPLDVDRLKAKLLRDPAKRPGRKFDPNAKRRSDYSPEAIQALEEKSAAKAGKGKPYAIGTVVSILSLFRRIASFGVKRRLCDGLRFKVEIPTGAKQKTEDMSEEQMARYIRMCREWPDPQAGNFQLLEIYTGMRRGEVRKLKWSDVDFNRGFILLRDPKGGEDQQIPLSDTAAELLRAHPHDGVNPYVFAGEKGGQRGIRQIDDSGRKIRDAAGLPKDFRPNHGLRHTFASHLASSGEVDLYTLQRLMTHKDPKMTQRYAHLRDATLKAGANVMGRIAASAKETG